MQRQSQEALDELVISDEIIASIETHGVEVAALLEEKWTTDSTPPDDDPGVERAAASPPDYLGNLLSLRDGLDASATSLGRADHAHVHQLATLLELREDRDDLTLSAFQMFSSMRRTIEELHGEGKAFVLAAFEGPTARTPKKLLRQIDLALPPLFTPNLKLTQVKLEGVTVDSKAMARGLQKLADKLRLKQVEYRRALRTAQSTRKERRRRIQEHHSNNIWTARIVEGYYRLAGEKELSQRLRPIVSRTRRSEPDPTDTDPAGNEPADSVPAGNEPDPTGNDPVAPTPPATPPVEPFADPAPREPSTASDPAPPQPSSPAPDA